MTRPSIRRTPAELALVLLGCTLMLTVGDQFHVQFGVIGYPGPGVLWGQAWWVPPLFAIASVGFVVAAWPLAPFIEKPTRRSIIVDTAWFFGSYVASGLLGHRVVGLTSLFVGLWMYRIANRTDRRPVVWLSLALAVLGTLGESAIHATGAGWYTNRNILLVPAWLPVLYMQGAPLALSITRWVRGEPPPEVSTPEAEA